MQPDAGLIEDIQDIHQLAADLRCEPDTLALAAREGRGRAVEREIAQADLLEEPYPVGNLFEKGGGNQILPLGELRREPLNPLVQGIDVHSSHLGDVLAGNLEAERLLLEARPAAHGADGLLHEALFAGQRFFALAAGGGHAGDDAIEAHHLLVGAAADPEKLVRPVQDHAEPLFGNVTDGVVEGETVFLGNGLHHLESRILAVSAQRRDAAGSDGKPVVGDNLVGVHLRNLAQTAAMRACPLRRVEREGVRSGDIERHAGVGADIILAQKAQRAAAVFHDGNAPLALSERRDHRRCDPAAAPFVGQQLVHDQIDEVCLVAVQRLYGGQIAQNIVYQYLRISFLDKMLEKVLIMPFAARHQRRQQQNLPPSILAEYHIHYHGVGIAHHLLARRGRKGLRGAGVQQAEEVVNLCHRAYRRARVATGSLLLDGQDRAQAADVVDIGTLQHPHELPGICVQGVDIAALPFGIHGVEGERTLAAAAHAGHHHQCIPRNRERNVLEVV